MSIYKKNLGIISSITSDQYVGYYNNSLIIDNRYLSYIRPSYNFLKTYNIIKTSFLKLLLFIELSKTNEYDTLLNVGLDSLILLSNNSIYNNLEQQQLKNLHAILYKLFSEIKNKKLEIKDLEFKAVVIKLKEHTKININQIPLKNGPDINPDDTNYKKHSRVYKTIVSFFSYIKNKLSMLKTTIFSIF